jgi:hypothetical protein
MKNLKEYYSVVEVLFLEKKKLFDKICRTCYVAMGSVGKGWKNISVETIAYVVLTHHTQFA